LSSIIEGTTEKGSQFMKPLMSIYNRNFGFVKQKCIFENYREFQARKTLLIEIICAMKKITVDLFRAAPYMLMLVLHQDALFHWYMIKLGRKTLQFLSKNGSIRPKHNIRNLFTAIIYKF
jgi:hypothetical protein